MITNELLAKRHRQARIILILVSLILIYFIVYYRPVEYNRPTALENKTINREITSNTVRIYGGNPYETACSISQLAYPATFHADKPAAVILVRDDRKLDGILAARLIHDPINAPILYINKDEIPETTFKEMNRLDPQGVFVDRNIKAILIGDVGNRVLEQIKTNGWMYRHIKGSDPFELGKNIDDYISTIHGDHEDNVIVAPVNAPDYAYVQAAWNAHRGTGFFFINRDSVPEMVVEALKNRYEKAYIYILGDNDSISPEVELELAKYGHVQRVPQGTDIYSQSTAFAAFKDVGKNFSWWISKEPRDFGWGISGAGHNFTFVNPEDWHSAVAAALLSHRGKHGPLILIDKDVIPEPVKDYLTRVRPYNIAPQNMLFNHGWIIGSQDYIGENIQGELDELLSQSREH
jgi:putative cell wall-binding protein